MPDNKRHAALAGLARDHERFLEEAEQVRKLVEGDEDAKPTEILLTALLEFWRRMGEAHLREEEEIVLPAWLAADFEVRPDIDRAKEEHKWLREAIQRLEAEELFGPERLALIGQVGWRMRDHVRWEEEEMLPRIEESLSEDGLKRLATETKNFRAMWRGSEAVVE